MKNAFLKNVGITTGCLLSLSIGSKQVLAVANSLENKGTVQVESAGVTQPVDPENPGQVVDPGEGPSTEGTLRLDYVSSLDFGNVQITDKGRTYTALAQQFFSETGPRGSYIQLTDERTADTGWTLQVKQNHQFRNEIIQELEEQELTGAVLSLDKAWANSNSLSEAPMVTRETIALNAFDTAYELARASGDSGRGVWTIAFGASETNTGNQATTLTPIVDQTGQAVIDEVYQKPAYSNSAITLTVPETTKIYPVQYDTTLTWILTAAP